jgi:hypothetical protein
MIRGLNRKLVEEITDTDLGILTPASTGDRLPTGNKRTIRDKLKAQYRVGLDQRRDSLNRAILGRNI